MAKFSLIPFSELNSPPIILTSELNENEESLFVSYKLTGNLSEIDLEDGHSNHQRKSKLWEKTCFELFIKNEQNAYLEFNFSSIFEWNVFYFEKQGNPLKEYKNCDSIKIDILRSLDIFHIIVEIDKRKIPIDFKIHQRDVGITSVIKDKKGHLSYWALSHEDTKPNFHHFDSFKYKF